MMNLFVKNETVSKFWLTEITGLQTVSRICCEYAGGTNPTEISGIFSVPGIMANIRGHHVSMHCNMASQVIENFLSFFQFYELSVLLNPHIYILIL